MWLVKTFFIGQVACEQAIEALKKQQQTVCEKTEKLEQNCEAELNSEKEKSKQFLCQLDKQFKRNVAGIRKGFKPFDNACHSLSQLLVETAEIKDATVEAGEKELVNA